MYTIRKGQKHKFILERSGLQVIIGIFLVVTFFTASFVLIYLSMRAKKEMERKKIECTEIAKGTVEEIRKIGDGENNDNYYPTFAFFDGNCIVQEESKIGYSKGVWKKGDSVQIRFNAKKPSDFWVVSDSIPVWVWLISIGIGFAAIGALGILLCYFTTKY